MNKEWVYLRDHFWFDLKVGGSVVHTSGIINALFKVVDLHVITNDHLTGISVNEVSFHPPKFRYPSELASIIYSFSSLINIYRVKPGYIYTRYSAFSFGWLLYKFLFKEVIVVLEYNSSDYWKLKNWKEFSNIFWLGCLQRLYYRFLRPIARFTEYLQLRYANRIVVVSEELKNGLVNRSFDAGKIYFYHNGVDAGIFTNAQSSIEISGNYFYWVGTFGPWHGIDTLLEAFRRFSSVNNDIKLVLAGIGPLYNYARSLAVKFNLSERIIFTGQIDHEDSISLMQNSLACLNTPTDNIDGTPFFGSPTKLFEYFLSGRPVFCSDVASLKDFSDLAVFFSQGNCEELAELMTKIAEENYKYDDLAARAKQSALSNYSWDKHIQHVLHGIL